MRRTRPYGVGRSVRHGLARSDRMSGPIRNGMACSLARAMTGACAGTGSVGRGRTDTLRLTRSC